MKPPNAIVALKAERLAQCIRAADIAHTLGVHENTVYNWERGVTSPTWPQAVAWARALDMRFTLAPRHNGAQKRPHEGLTETRMRNAPDARQ